MLFNKCSTLNVKIVVDTSFGHKIVYCMQQISGPLKLNVKLVRAECELALFKTTAENFLLAEILFQAGSDKRNFNSTFPFKNFAFINHETVIRNQFGLLIFDVLVRTTALLLKFSGLLLLC